ncbi:MAG TPA: CPBP family intramembrane glutamic endopeptidase [Chitinophagales bacterium]|nr:CPBP family intramembrane glutamic endopeptidase [Chitinophagales bacterium]
MKEDKLLPIYIFRLLGFYFLGSLLAQLFAFALLFILYPNDYQLPMLELTQKYPSAWMTLRGVQLIHAVFSFLIPSLIVWKQYAGSYDFSMPEKNRSSLFALPIIPFLLLSFFPLVQNLYQFNMGIHFFEPLQTILMNMEQQMNTTIEGMLKDRSVLAMGMNFLVIAVVASILEELFFRGVLQRILTDYIDPHVAIFISAFIFSAIHLQFFGFLPRLALGIFLGYLYLHSGRLIVPIFAHLIFNGSQLIIYYQSGQFQQSLGEESEKSFPIHIIIPSIIMFLILYHVFYTYLTKFKQIAHDNE